MRTKRLQIKRFVVAGVSCIVLYLFLCSGYHEYDIDTLIVNARPEDVWEFVADFSKMRLLNPTILNFKILADDGNRDNWRYTVLYDEQLSHWPYWKNTAKADYLVMKSPPDSKDEWYTIESKHQTCFFAGAYCLNTESQFKFSSAGNDAYCVEKIWYECPPFLSSACRRELEYQRKAVIHNLTTIFNRKQQVH